MDIGGGTSNLALIEDGKIVATTCLNVGGRLLKMDEDGRILYISPVLKGLFHQKEGEAANRGEVEKLAEKLVQALEMVGGLREKTELLEKLRTKEVSGNWLYVPSGTVISFSGGVADCIESEKNWMEFGDMGPELGKAIRKSRLCQGEYMLGAETIRATVIGAGCHSAQLSGSTVFHQNVAFPLKNLPVVEDASALAQLDGPGVLMITGEALDFAGVRDLAKHLTATLKLPVYLAVSADLAKALGVQLALAMGPESQILCIDRVCLREGDFLDVGAPVGPAIPVVVKTLILSR